MTVQLDWPAEVVARITKDAIRSGLTLDEYLLRTVLDKAAANEPEPDEEAKRRQREEAGRSIVELRRGNVLGPDLTIRDLIEEGRRF